MFEKIIKNFVAGGVVLCHHVENASLRFLVATPAELLGLTACRSVLTAFIVANRKLFE